MRTEVVTAPPYRNLLDAVRRTLDDADEVLLCVAFAQARGVHLIAEELHRSSRRRGARVVMTTAFSDGAPAITALEEAGARVKILNASRGTFHPKVFLGCKRETREAVVGSVNLTSGLVANVEAATRLVGASDDRQLVDLWAWAENRWTDAEPWVGAREVEEAIEPDLLRLLVAARRPVVYTLGHSPKPNYVSDVTAGGVWVETERTRKLGTSAQLVPPRMLNLAWDALRARGELANTTLLNELRVHRSSVVCALLARLPGVEVVSERPIVLRYSAVGA